MTKYINKDTLVAEIENLIKRAEAERVLHPKTILAAKNLLLIEDYKKLLSIIDTFEVEIGVDLGDSKGDKSVKHIIDTKTFEMKESEDERIRKDIISFLRSKNGYMNPDEDLDFHNRWLPWLEQQGGQKSFDYENANIPQKDFAPKIEPKFKVGDWVMLDRPVLITKVEDMPYNTHQYLASDDKWFGDATKSKLWTIQDAKDGDVLTSKDMNHILIFKNLDTSDYFSSYYNVSYNKAGKGDSGWCNRSFVPATEEQRDLLFQKMKEAGYEWDADKKELKKI